MVFNFKRYAYYLFKWDLGVNAPPISLLLLRFIFSFIYFHFHLIFYTLSLHFHYFILGSSFYCYNPENDENCDDPIDADPHGRVTREKVVRIWRTDSGMELLAHVS